MPEGAADQVSVELNSVPVTPRMRGDGVLVIPLSVDVPPPYVLSLQYYFPHPQAGTRQARRSLAGVGAMKFDFPTLGDDTWVRRAYWQLLLPPEQHLVVSPRELTGEFAWCWNFFYFGRKPVLSQVDLERVVGLRHPGSTPAPAGMNTYLFSSLGRIGPCEVVTASRTTIVFVASGLALLAGLLLIYVRAARHPVVLLVATAILAGLAAIYPELAMLAAQASAVGLALVLLAALLRHLTAGYPLVGGGVPALGSRLPEVSSSVVPILAGAPAFGSRPSEPAVPAPATQEVPRNPAADHEYTVPGSADPPRVRPRSFRCPRMPRHEGLPSVTSASAVGHGSVVPCGDPAGQGKFG